MAEATMDILTTIGTQWKSLTIANDFVFGKVMLNADLCREVLEAILGLSIERIEYVGRQELLDASPESKAVRLDVYVRDGEGTVYNVEMQAVDTHELPRRSRYYQALMALDQIRRGEPYSRLRDSYVIFICGFDLFGQGRRVYSFENRCCDGSGLALGDGAKTIFLAASAPRQGEDFGLLDELLDYVAQGEVSGELSARLDTEVAHVLNSEKWRLEYMMLEVRDQLSFDRGVAQGKEQGLAEGLAEGESRFSKLVAALLKDGRIDDVTRAVENPEVRDGLYRAYGIA